VPLVIIAVMAHNTEAARLIMSMPGFHSTPEILAKVDELFTNLSAICRELSNM
jgi:hypothetical protein